MRRRRRKLIQSYSWVLLAAVAGWGAERPADSLFQFDVKLRTLDPQESESVRPSRFPKRSAAGSPQDPDPAPPEISTEADQPKEEDPEVEPEMVAPTPPLPSEEPVPEPFLSNAQPLTLPLFIGNKDYGELEALVGEGDAPDVLLPFDEVFRIFEPLIEPSAERELTRRGGGHRYILLSSLQEMGLEVNYDNRNLILRIEIPASMRELNTIQLYSRRPPSLRERPLPPAKVSAYLNARAGVDYVGRSEFGEQGVQPFRTGLDGAINIHDWVLESSVNYAEGARYDFTRGDTRLVRDDPARALRYQLGDLSYPVSGFQNYQSLLGVGVARNFALQPYRVTSPLGSQGIMLNTPSKVEVFVNGRPIQTVFLPAGPHDLRSFPFVSGGNDVMIRITDELGRTEDHRLSYFYDPRLLAQGEHEFTYNVGVGSSRSTGRIEYEEQTLAATLFHRWGVTDAFTLGFNLQGDGDFQMSGAESVLATQLGTFSGDVAYSYLRGEGLDGAARFQYRYADEGPDNLYNSVFTFSTQYRGRHFATLAPFFGNNPVEWEIAARYTQRLPWSMSGSVSGGYQFRRDNVPDTHFVSFLASKRWHRNLTTDLTLERNNTFSGETDYRAFLSFTLLLPEHRQSIIGSQDTLSQVSRIDWHYQPEYLVGGVGATAGLIRARETYGAVGSARYVNYRSETYISHDISTPHSRFGGELEDRSSLRFGTALVYADGSWAVTRPVQDSFAIAEVHEGLAAAQLGIDPVEDTYAARRTFMGPAVIPDLTSYLYRNVEVEAQNAPVGFDLGSDRKTLFPSYKSGTVIKVGEGPTVILEGILVSNEGEVVPLQAGEMIEVATQKATPFFTNRRGRFYVEGLKDGAFELVLYSAPDQKISFDIPPDSEGVYDVLELQFEQPLPKQ